MSDVERYFAMPVENGVDMVPDQDGGWVDYDDWRALHTKLGTLRAEAAYVRGHLESLADSIEAFGVNGNEGEEKLWKALREDSERLGKLGGSE